MRKLIAFVLLCSLLGCAGDFSKVPEPTGEWVPANPASLTAEANPSVPVRRSPGRPVATR